MARAYIKDNALSQLAVRRRNIYVCSAAATVAMFVLSITPFAYALSPGSLAFIGGVIPFGAVLFMAATKGYHVWIEKEREAESERRSGKPVLGVPPNRQAFEIALTKARKAGKGVLDRYLVGFEVDSGEPIWINDDDICGHGAVFAKTGVGKTLWLEGLMFQQMLRGRASGFTFIDAKRDPGTLADMIMMALITGRIEDLIVIDPFDPVCAYNFVFTTQRADVKARKVLRCGLPPTSDQSVTKHYDRLAADAVYRVVRAMESLGLAWSVRDIAVALSAFTVAYPRMRALLHERGAKQAMVELGHLAGSYRTAKGGLDSTRLTDNLRGIASELHSISNSEAGEMFCVPRADLSLTDAIFRGKIIYYMLPRLEEAESAARMVKVFREDLEVSIGEITSSRHYRLEDPHLVIIDEGASTFGPTWANLFELARKGRFALFFGAQSVGGLMDETLGLSEQFYERVLANVNLKVVMRVGDNRTAMDMSEWIGKITMDKKSFGVGVSTGLTARELTKHVEVNKRSADGAREAVTVAEDETDLVSPEELKHEMSAEKGLAWFDLGDGRLRKGRGIWFDSDLPARWQGREYLVRYESIEADEIGLAEWVDEHILSYERAETERDLNKLQSESPAVHPVYGGGGGVERGRTEAPVTSPSGAPLTEGQPLPDEDEPFRFNLLRGFRGRPRARTFVGVEPENTQQSEKNDHNDSKTATEAKQSGKGTHESPSIEKPEPVKQTGGLTLVKDGAPKPNQKSEAGSGLNLKGKKQDQLVTQPGKPT